MVVVIYSRQYSEYESGIFSLGYYCFSQYTVKCVKV